MQLRAIQSSDAISFLVISVKRDFPGHSFVDSGSFSRQDPGCLFSKWQLDLLFSFSSLSRSICRLVRDPGSVEKSIYFSVASFPTEGLWGWGLELASGGQISCVFSFVAQDGS